MAPMRTTPRIVCSRRMLSSCILIIGSYVLISLIVAEQSPFPTPWDSFEWPRLEYPKSDNGPVIEYEIQWLNTPSM